MAAFSNSDTTYSGKIPVRGRNITVPKNNLYPVGWGNVTLENAEQAQKDAGLGGGSVSQQLAAANEVNDNINSWQNYNFIKDQAADPFAKLALGITLGVATAGIGSAIGPAVSGAVGGGLSGSVAGGAASGVATGALSSAVQGQNIGKGALVGGLMGGVGGGLKSVSGGLNQGLTNQGINPALSSGITKGVIGAGASALGAGLAGTNPGIGAISGGVGGFLGGAVGSSTGSSTLGTVASGLGGKAIAPFLGSNGSLMGGGGSGSPSGGGHNYLGAGAGVGGQGNNGNMAGTDSTLASTITGALPGVIQGAAGVYGSQNAAEKMTQADQNAIGTQQSTLGNINNIWGTQQQLGQGAQNALGSALGTNGKPADYSGFQNMPGYQFAVQQGTQAIQRQAASMGNAYTPNTAAAVGQYVTGTASQNYNNYINQLMGAAGLGNQANAGIANPTYQTGANISQLQQNQGYAQASGVSGGANAVGGIFGPNGVGSSLIGAAGRYLGGGGSGGGGGAPAYGSAGYSDPFAGTDLARGGYTNYNMNNGPTSGDIGNVTVGSTSGDYGIPAFDPNSVSTPTMPDISSGDMHFGGSLDYGNTGTDFMGGF